MNTAKTLRRWTEHTLYTIPPEPIPQHSEVKAASHTRKAAHPRPRSSVVSEVTYRNVAAVLCQTEPDDKGYSEALETTLASVKALPAATRLALCTAYVFAAKVPYEEREDCFQTFTANLITRGISDAPLAYAVARSDWLDWWRAYKIRQHADLDSTVEDGEGNATTLGNLIVGEVEFEEKLGSQIDAASLWEKIPADIKPLIVKRMTGRALITTRTNEPVAQPLIGKNRRAYAGYIKRGRPKTDAALTDCERQRFNRWIHKSGASLLLSVSQ